VYSLIVQYPLKIGAKFRFDGRTNVVDFAWAPSKLTKARIRLWLWYGHQQHFPHYIKPLFRVLGSKRNTIGDISKCASVLLAWVTFIFFASQVMN
jgi:hypothetical protein